MMTAVDRDTLLLVGVCGPPHGVKGEVKVVPQTDDPERLLDLERVWIGTSPEDAAEQAVVGSRLQTARRGTVVLTRFEGIDHRDAAESLRRQRVYATPEDLPPLEEGEIYLHELRDLEVFALADGEPERVGVVADVIEGVAQNLLVVRRDGQPDALVPDVEEIVVEVDLDAGTLTIRPPEGLLD